MLCNKQLSPIPRDKRRQGMQCVLLIRNGLRQKNMLRMCCSKEEWSWVRMTWRKRPVRASGGVTMEPHSLAPSGFGKALMLLMGGRRKVKAAYGDTLWSTVLKCWNFVKQQCGMDWMATTAAWQSSSNWTLRITIYTITYLKAWSITPCYEEVVVRNQDICFGNAESSTVSTVDWATLSVT